MDKGVETPKDEKHNALRNSQRFTLYRLVLSKPVGITIHFPQAIVTFLNPSGVRKYT